MIGSKTVPLPPLCAMHVGLGTGGWKTDPGDEKFCNLPDLCTLQPGSGASWIFFWPLQEILPRARWLLWGKTVQRELPDKLSSRHSESLQGNPGCTKEEMCSNSCPSPCPQLCDCPRLKTPADIFFPCQGLLWFSCNQNTHFCSSATDGH